MRQVTDAPTQSIIVIKLLSVVILLGLTLSSFRAGSVPRAHSQEIAGSASGIQNIRTPIPPSLGLPSAPEIEKLDHSVRYLELAEHYAPVWRQLTAFTPGYDYVADYITRFDYDDEDRDGDGDWKGLNNWDNLYNTGISRDFRAYVYYAVAETTTHWFITYAIFHPRDWGESSTDRCSFGFCHENDMEGVLVTVGKDGSQYGELQVVETVYHLWFLPYTRDERIDFGRIPVKGVIQDYQLEGGSHVKLCVERRGHGVRLYTPDNCDPASSQMIYRYKGVAEQPESRNDPDVGYALTRFDLGDELWKRRWDFGDNEPFAEYGTFRGDDYGENKAHAPWGWDMYSWGIDRDGVPSGWIFTNPAWAVATHLDFPNEQDTFSLAYVSNDFCVDPDHNGCTIINQPPPTNPPPEPGDSPPLPTSDQATFIADVTMPDGTAVSSGQALHKVWSARNTGTSTWDSGYELVFVGGDQMSAPDSVPVPTTAPGATADVAVDMIAPSAPGTYVGYWQLRNDQGVFFGPRLWVKIQVPSEATQDHITVFTFAPSSPSGADVVRIQARVENFPNFRAMRVRVDDGVLCELGSPEITCEWHTAGYADGAHTVMVEVADQTDTSWNHPERRVATYVLEGPRGSSNHGPGRPTPQSPYDWYVTTGSPPELCVNPVADPEGDPVQYYFETQASVGSANSGWMGNPCWTPPSSLDPGTYEWRVKARDSHGAESDWSDAWHYSVEASGVTINDVHFDPPSPSGAEQVKIYACTEGHAGVNISLSVRVNDAPDGSDSGQWRIIKELGVPCFNDVDAPVWNTLAFPNGDHLVRVVATAIEPAASDVRDKVYHLNHRRPAGPELLAPVNSEDIAQIVWLNSRTVAFRWRSGAIPGTPDRTSSYRLRVSTNPDPAIDPIVDVSLGSSTTSYVYTFSSNYPQLYWHVVASNDVGSTTSGTAHIGIDRNLPSSQVQALPAVTADNVFVVRWSGSDDRSGIRWYDVQVRDGERGEWQDWLGNTTETFALFTGHPGHTYYFRCRAQDNAGNREEYPTGDGDTFTLIDPTSRPPEPWWNGAYSAKRNLVILNNDDDTLPAGYPVHLHFDDTTNPTASELYNASLLSTKGDDFRIVYNNATELDRVVQNFSPSTIDIWFRTQAAIESAMADTTSYQLYYGNPAATNPPANPNNVWYPAPDTYTRVLLRMQEGTGTTVGDSSGYGNHCTFGSTALSWTTGKFGATAVHFPGHNPDGPALDCGRNGLDLRAFTIEMWIKRNSLQQGDGRLAGQLESGYPPKHLFSLFGDQLRLDIWPCTTCGSSEVRSDGRIRDTNWHHVAVTFDGGNQVAFYIDGALDSVKTLAQTGWSPSGARLQVGGAENIARFDGEMSFFRLSNVVRTSFPHGSFAAIGDEPEVRAESEVGYEPPPSGSPDLVVEDVTVYPVDASLGGGLLVRAVVRNAGDGPTQKGFYTDLYLDHQPTGVGDYQGSVRFWVASPIEPSTTITLTGVITDTGTGSGLRTATRSALAEAPVVLYVQTDSSGVLNEPDERNNISSGIQACLASADGYEGDDTAASATLLTLGTAQVHNFHATGDQDWFRFVAEAGVQYAIFTEDLGELSDTYLYLYDTDGETPLAVNDDDGESLASRVDWTAPADDTYYVLVRHWNPSDAGCGTGYTIRLARIRSLYLPVVLRGYTPPSLSPTPTPTPTGTIPPAPTSTATSTSTPTRIPTPTQTHTSTPTHTPTPTPTHTPTPTRTPTPTPTYTPTPTSTNTPTPVPYWCDPDTVALWHFNEGSGNTAYEACGVHPGTLSGTYSWIGGRYGSAVQFGAIGYQGKMTASSSSRMNNMDRFTVEFWINRNCASTNDQIMGKSAPGAESWIIRMSDRRIETEVYWGNGSTRVASNAQLECETWYYVAVTYDGSYVRIYINGALNNSAPNANGVRHTSSPFWIADSGLVAGIDEARISDIARSSFPAP